MSNNVETFTNFALDHTTKHIVISTTTRCLPCTIVGPTGDAFKTNIECYFWRRHPILKSTRRTHVHLWTETGTPTAPYQPIALPIRLKRRLKEALEKIHTAAVDKGPYDCLGLVRYLVGAPKLLLEIKDIADVRCGDIIMARGGRGWHVAMFLTPRHILHKLGSNGMVIITDFASALIPYDHKEGEYIICRPVDPPSSSPEAIDALNLDNFNSCGVLLQGETPDTNDFVWNKNHPMCHHFTD